MDFGKRLASLRKINNVTQEELGKVIGVGKTTVSNYETGYSSPDYEMLKKIANHFGVSTDELLYDPDELKEVEAYRRVNEATLDKINKHNESILQKTSTKGSDLAAFLHTKIAENAIAEINQMLKDNPELLPYVKELLVSAKNLTPSQVEMLNGFIKSMTDSGVIKDKGLATNAAEGSNKYDPLAASGNPNPMDDLPQESLNQIEELKLKRLKRFKKD